MEFESFSKIPRLSKEMVITEKIDGTNASVWIEPIPNPYIPEEGIYADNGLLDGVVMRFGSRGRFLTRKTDNYGFCNWAMDNAVVLSELGYGTHYGEWWGFGIQRNYGLKEKRFSLFNTGRWIDPRTSPGDPVYGNEIAPTCCYVVPVLYFGAFDTNAVESTMTRLYDKGSDAAPGFNKPEGAIIYHIAAKQYFKKTFEKDGGKKDLKRSRFTQEEINTGKCFLKMTKKEWEKYFKELKALPNE